MNKTIPDNITTLEQNDSLNIIFEKQAILQERLGRMALARSSNMKEKCDMIKDDIFNVTEELHEMMRELPYKHWKQYDKDFIKGWLTEEHRHKTLMEYIDALHFFLNIGLILGFQPEEIFHFYIAKNLENHRRQDEGY